MDEIPTARPTLRKDLPDLIYKDQFSKWNAIAKTSPLLKWDYTN